jgi:hypothetical protein
MSEGADDIERGRAAWLRLRDAGRRSWEEWKLVARALAIGRCEAMQAAGSNRPLGSKYNAAMGQFLRRHGFDIDNQQRYRALLCLENENAIERWRASLSEKQRNLLNHPNAVWTHWMRATRPAIEPKTPTIRTNGGKARPVFWPQDALRRAHRAMLDCRSSDLLRLARVALEAAVRDENDLRSLLDETPRRPMPASADAVHAA